ncbi:LLGL2 protein [Ostertagia ostertagi]
MGTEKKPGGVGNEIIDMWEARSITWTRDGSRFVLALQDGSYASCDPLNASTCERPPQVFGPFPCVPTKKAFFAETSSSDERIVLFSGGMPHASYGDRFVVTARQGDRTCVFDFASPVIDFLLTTGGEFGYIDDGYHTCALVLTENELVCIDLTDRYWRVIPTEQIFPLHASQITTSTHCSHVEKHVWSKLNKLSAEEIRRNRKFSTNAWPLNAKIPVSDETRVVKEATKRQLYLTGHENGTVRVWSAGHSIMQLLFVIDTRIEFLGFVEEGNEASDGKINDCETDSSDDEYQITNEWPPFKKVGDYDPFCDDAGLSVQRIAFDDKSGHIVVGCRGGHVLVYSLEEDEKELTPQTLNVELYESSKLPPQARNSHALPAREIPKKYLPGYQPYALSVRNKSALVQLRPALAVSAVASISSRHLVAASNEYGFAVIDMDKQAVILQNSLLNQSVESPTWFIRCLKFLSVPAMGIAGVCDVFVVGTNGGKLVIYTITDQPRAEDVCKLLRTITLRHGAPIIHVDVILEPGTRASSARLIIFTEEQIRSFYLPSLKPSRYKVKLTSVEGLRIRKASIVTLHNVNDLSNCESFAAIVNNHGEVAVYSLSNPKKTEKFSVLKSTDVAGISSMLITPFGELLYLRQGGSELQRATISEHSLPWTMPGQGSKWPEEITPSDVT